ncbi:MAG: calcium/sodium antiporter [Thiotrichaceae bacterium]|nr:calcium/sodium antiporter [Thiotrichaceae bacterium]
MDSFIFYIIAIILGFALLIWSSGIFVDGAADLATHFGISPIIVGMIIIGFGTSAPEIIISAVAAFKGSSDIGIGNALGSNITNITLVLGITAIFYVIPVSSRMAHKELPVLLACSTIAMATLFFGKFGIIDGIILFTTLALVLLWMVKTAQNKLKPEPLLNNIEKHFPAKHKKTAILWTTLGLVVLIVSSNLLVWGSSHIARSLGVSDLVIGLTIVAIGTSLPELAATITSAKKGETDLAIGNIIGSNFFNTLGVLAIPALFAAGEPDSAAVWRDMPIVIGLTLLLLLFTLSFDNKKVINRWKGIVFFGLFIGYQIMLFYQSTNNSGRCHSFLCL